MYIYIYSIIGFTYYELVQVPSQQASKEEAQGGSGVWGSGFQRGLGFRA